MRALVRTLAGITFLVAVVMALPATAQASSSTAGDLPVPFDESDLPVPFEDIDIVPFD